MENIMKKNTLFFTCVFFVILLAGCGGNDLGECDFGNLREYKCSGKDLYFCSTGGWFVIKECKSGCDSSPGRQAHCFCKQTQSTAGLGATLMWSSKISPKTFDEAEKYCDNFVSSKGYNDWRLPNIDALRTLIQNCPNTSPMGKCAVSNECLTDGYTDDCETCGASNPAISKLDDTGVFWSSSDSSGYSDYRWTVDFTDGSIHSYRSREGDGYATNKFNFRCVRTKKAEGGSNNQNPCDPNPCIGVANSTEVCTAVNTTKYLCECEDGFTWNKTSCDIWCDKSNTTPCKDAETDFMWSAKSTSEMTWDEAKSYCEALGEGNYDNWRFPTIDELRSLIDGCSNTKSGGKCKVSATNGCLSSKDCWDSSCNSCGQTNAATISKFGDSDIFWSSSVRSDRDDSAWYVDFSDGKVHNEVKSNSYYVRCVR